MKGQKFKKKPTIVEAMQFIGTEDNVDDLAEFTRGMFIRSYSIEKNKDWDYTLRTLEGNQYPTVGDWVIKGSSSQYGVHYWINKPDYFAENYEKVSEMIENDIQYEITKKWAKKFKESYEGIKDMDPNNVSETDPLLVKAYIESYKIQYEELEEQIKEYERRTNRSI